MGLFEYVLSFFYKELTPGKIKQKKLKEIKNELSRSNKFFNASKVQVYLQFAKVLHGFYKLFLPLKTFSQKYKSSENVMHFVVEKYLTDNQMKALDFVYSFSAKDNFDFSSDLSKKLNQNLSYLFKNTTPDQIKIIDDTYEALQHFFDLISYNYYSFLKKFDSLLPENDLIYKPRFNTINCGVVIDDLKDLLECLCVVKDVVIWKNIYDISLEIYRDKENFPIKPNVWIKTVASIIQLNRSNEILNMIRYVSGDPGYLPMSSIKKSKGIANLFFNNLTKRVTNEIEKIKIIQKNKKSQMLAYDIFQGMELVSMDHYNERVHLKITSKVESTSGYIYYDLFSYLKSYVVYFIKKELSDIINLLIIKGQWRSADLSRKLSDNMHSLLNSFNELLELDRNMGEQGYYGNRINALLHRVSGGDISSEKLLLSILSDVNKKALIIANNYYNRIQGIEKRLGESLVDYLKPAPERELIYNWKELDLEIVKVHGSNFNFNVIIKGVLENLSLFLKLMNLYLEHKA